MRDAMGAGDVIFLNKNCIEQADPMIDAATAFDGVFLLESQARQGFARVENAALGARDGGNILRRNRCRRG